MLLTPQGPTAPALRPSPRIRPAGFSARPNRGRQKVGSAEEGRVGLGHPWPRLRGRQRDPRPRRAVGPPGDAAAPGLRRGGSSLGGLGGVQERALAGLLLAPAKGISLRPRAELVTALGVKALPTLGRDPRMPSKNPGHGGRQQVSSAAFRLPPSYGCRQPFSPAPPELRTANSSPRYPPGAVA